jgi:hypothetical protein
MEDKYVHEVEETQQEEVTQEQQEATDKERNFAAMREKNMKMQHERDAALQELQRIRLEREQLQQNEKKTLDPDDLVEARYLDEKIKELKEELKGYQTKVTYESQESKLRSEFPDIEKVVSRENLEALSQMYPELADSIRSNNDLYSKGKAAYTLIKKMGVYQEDKYSADKERIEANYNKPKPLASLNVQEGSSPLSKANIFSQGLTEELKKQLYKEMVEAAKNG